MVKSKTKYQKYQNSKPILINKIHQNTIMSYSDQTMLTIKPWWPSRFREREDQILVKVGFGHRSSAMDLEKMNIKFKTQKIWIQT